MPPIHKEHETRSIENKCKNVTPQSNKEHPTPNQTTIRRTPPNKRLSPNKDGANTSPSKEKRNQRPTKQGEDSTRHTKLVKNREHSTEETREGNASNQKKRSTPTNKCTAVCIGKMTRSFRLLQGIIKTINQERGSNGMQRDVL